MTDGGLAPACVSVCANYRSRCTLVGVASSNSLKMPVQEEKWLTAPLEVIGKLHEERGMENNDDFGAVGYFTELLQSQQTLAKVPFLNVTPLEQLPDGCLVRYRGMVQDQFDPELYLRYYTAVNTTTGHQIKGSGVYRDLIDLPPGYYTTEYENPSNVTRDRHTLYCVPIPGQTEWAKHTYNQGAPPMCDIIQPMEHKPMVKRTLEEMEDGSDEQEEGEMEVAEGAQCGGTKRAKEEGTSDDRQQDQVQRCTQPDMNYPLPDETGLPCLLKVYGDSVDALHVTSVVDCVGVLSKHPQLANFEPVGEEASEGDMLGETAAERSVHCPPPSLVPRLHCILVTKLNHCNPHLPRDLICPLPIEVYHSQFEGIAKSRDLVLSLLTTALLGDRLAAEFTLLHLLSSVHGRTDMMTLGKMSLNLTHCPGTTAPPPTLPLAPSIHKLLAQILTQSVLLPLSLSVMNTWKFSPCKDYTLNRLVAGALQLAPGTHLLVDETALEPGRLSEVGVQNLAALGHVIQQQSVTYDFQFHKTEFECDLPIMVLTEGKKSLLTVDCILPLSPSSSPYSLPSLPNEQQLIEARIYLSLHRMLQYRLPPDVQKAVEDDFVAMRKTNQTMTADRFHHLLCLARLVSLSYGCCELSLAHWNHAKHLQTQRLARQQTLS